MAPSERCSYVDRVIHSSAWKVNSQKFKFASNGVLRSSHSLGPNGQGASGRGRRRLGVLLLPTHPGEQLSGRRRGGHVLGAQHLEKARRFDPTAGVLGSECPIPVCMLVGGVHSLLGLPQV